MVLSLEVQMPDRDNLSKSLKKPWGGAVNAARQGPEVLARFAAAVTTEVIVGMGNTALLEQLSSQLVQTLAISTKEREGIVFQPPKNSETTRESLIALRAADRVLTEMVVANRPMTPAEVRSKLFDAYCLEIPKALCLGIIAVKVPDLYVDAQTAFNQLNACEDSLKKLLQKTAQELEANPNNPQITRLKKPRRKQRKSQEELVSSTPKMNLGNL